MIAPCSATFMLTGCLIKSVSNKMDPDQDRSKDFIVIIPYGIIVLNYFCSFNFIAFIHVVIPTSVPQL